MPEWNAVARLRWYCWLLACLRLVNQQSWMVQNSQYQYSFHHFGFSWTAEWCPFLILVIFLFSDYIIFKSRCSPRSGEGEGLRPAPGWILIVWQQPVHQPQRQCRVSVWRRLWLQLWVRHRGAAQQEEGASGGQLENRAAKTWTESRRRGTGEGERKSSPPPCQQTTTPGLPHRPSRSLSSISGWARWRLMTPQTSTNRCHNRLPLSTPSPEKEGGSQKDGRWLLQSI